MDDPRWNVQKEKSNDCNDCNDTNTVIKDSLIFSV